MGGHTDKTERTSYYFGREVDLKEAGHADMKRINLAEYRVQQRDVQDTDTNFRFLDLLLEHRLLIKKEAPYNYLVRNSGTNAYHGPHC